MNHIWSIICERSIKNQETNNISLIDVVEQINFSTSSQDIKRDESGVFTIPIKMDFVTLWSQDGDFQSNLEILLEEYSPDGKLLSSFEKKIPVPMDRKRLRSVTRMFGFKAKDSGVYRFVLKAKINDQYEKMAEVPIEVVIK